MRWYVSFAVRDLNGVVGAGLGSFNNQVLDGRLSHLNALEAARRLAEAEAKVKNREYLGFYMARGNDWGCLDNVRNAK